MRAQIKENIKAPRHWPLCVEFTGDRWIPAQMASNAENVSIWWRHHAVIWETMTVIWCRLHGMKAFPSHGFIMMTSSNGNIFPRYWPFVLTGPRWQSWGWWFETLSRPLCHCNDDESLTLSDDMVLLYMLNPSPGLSPEAVKSKVWGNEPPAVQLMTSAEKQPFTYTKRCRYNAVHFLPNPHIRSPITRSLGQDMGCLLWV